MPVTTLRRHQALEFAALTLSAALFAILLLGALVLSHFLWPDQAILARYDMLFLYCICVQALLIGFGLESWEEMRVIALYHLLGTGMEIFKVHVGSWVYPEPGLIRLYEVPLFAGFMYSAVGSFIARAWRLFDLRLDGPPPLWAMLLLALIAYVNFMTHHVTYDLRWVLFAASLVLFWRSRLGITLCGSNLKLPLLPVLVAVAVLIWGAENLATWARAWAYPYQLAGWRPVGIAKIGSWYLLMLLSFVLVASLHLRQKPSGLQPSSQRT
ncbi:MAG: DUF817 domain-containing protein [Neomegalonema sp.]|nr:DUF817 domain-containing protein [Neomegalonema sp.]